jgi:soluble lytic murein transglycosylase
VDTVTQARFFSNHTPITTQGRIAYINFLMVNNQKDKAIIHLKKLWHFETLTHTEQGKIIASYGRYLSRIDHGERIKNLVDKNQNTFAKWLLPYATANDAIKYNLRQKLKSLGRGALTSYNQSANSIKYDAGVLRSLVYYYRKTNQDSNAINVLTHLTQAQSSDNPQAWHDDRMVLSRVAFKAGDKKSAYKIIANHYLTDGGAYVDAEFYAGWLALRHLGQKQTALTHFKNGRIKSSLPISISRFEYWIGRSCTLLNDKPCAKIAYTNASKYFYTFYGQLGAYHNGQKTIAIPQFPQADTRIQNAYFNDSVIQASYAANAFGNDGDVSLMLNSVAERIGKHPAIYPLLEKTAKELGNLKTRVKLAKSASVNNDFLLDTGYPIINVKKTSHIPELALLYALTRQESEFDQYAQSPVGARGLMQLMPATAQHTARKLRMPYQLSYLTTRPDYNITLGGSYLNHLIHHFNGSYIHALSGYNAGPGRIGQWNTSYGRFTPDLYHIIDRIETIPFGETRNYVQRILETTQVYRAKMSGKKYISTENLVHDLKRGL